MSFLRINGYTIPIARCEQSIAEIGSRSAGLDGTPQVDRQRTKRVWQCETPALQRQIAIAVKALVLGKGDVWPFDEDLYSHKGRVATGTGTYDTTTPKYGSGALEPSDEAIPLDVIQECKDLTINAWVQIAGSGVEKLLNISGSATGYLNVAVGNGASVDAALLTSSDGVTWTERSTPSAYQLRSVAYGRSIFVAVGDDDGTDAHIATSPDGITWTERSNPRALILYGVCYAAALGLFVAVGEADGTDAYIVTSPDGITWTERSNPSKGHLRSVCFSPEMGLLVAVGTAYGGDAYIITSPDGITWTERANPKNAYLYGVACSGSLFVAVGLPDGGGDSYIVTSPDGITWTERSAPKNIWINGVAWSEALGLFVAVGDYDTDPFVATSPDGITWTERACPGGSNLYSISVGVGVELVAVGEQDGSDSLIVTSADGTTWTERSTPNTDSLLGVIGVQEFDAIALYRIATDELSCVITEAQSVTGVTLYSGTLAPGWHMLSIVVRSAPVSGEATHNLYVDGSLVDSETAAIPAFRDISVFDLLAEEFDDLLIAPYAASSDQILAWYGMSKAMLTLPHVYLDGDVVPDDDFTVEVVGTISGSTTVRASVNGVWTNNLEVVKFTLEEI